MNDYTEVRIDMSPCNETMTDVMAALLCEHGYESFVPDECGMTAYIKLEDFDRKVLDEVTAELPFDTSVTVKCETVEGRDWNQEWEKNYFMAFGTGHHQTTTLIIRRLLELPLEGRSVIDMGTGTGILAILAAMRGAGPVTAIEIDEFAHVNAVENVSLNHHPEINVVLGDASALAGVEPVDLFLANINRNIIVGDLQVYASRLKEGGTMLLSGFYEDDIAIVLDEARKHGLEYVGHTVLERWSCLELKK